MDIQLDAVQAVILVRDSPDATYATVLLAADEFEAYPNDFGTLKSIVKAGHLGKAVRTRAERKLNEEVDQLIMVFDSLPIPEGAQPPEDLESNDRINLRSPLKALKSSTSLRVPDGTPKVEEFYVLVTRLRGGSSTRRNQRLR